MTYLILFIFGLTIGSFLNVLALRYDGEHVVGDPKVIGGRSHCPHCHATLRWFELIPVISYIVQGAKCRHCGARIGPQYPIVELLSGIIFALVPWQLAGYPWILPALWIIALEILLLVAYIDIRLGIVPHELEIVLGVVAIFETIFAGAYLDAAHQSFLGPYASIFGLYGNIWLSHFAGALFGAGFFGLLVLVTRGKGMGLGDVKLGLPLGFLFGWPDIIVLYGVAFILGSIVGVLLIIFDRKTGKSAVPFVPFLAASAAFIFFLGFPAIQWYLRIIGV